MRGTIAPLTKSVKTRVALRGSVKDSMMPLFLTENCTREEGKEECRVARGRSAGWWSNQHGVNALRAASGGCSRSETLLPQRPPMSQVRLAGPGCAHA